MSVNNIGIRMIEPSIAITPRSATRPPRRERDGAEATVATDAVVRQAPPAPPPGTGKNVDKSV